jgi:hypothetical protein
MKMTFRAQGTVTIDFGAATIDVGGLALTPDPAAPQTPSPVSVTVPPPPPRGVDQIDLSHAVLTAQSPDVRGWPIGASMTEIGLSASEAMSVNFTKRHGPNAWPFVNGPEGGDLQYTLWVGCKIRGQWHLAGSILCISRGPDDNYVPSGPTLQPGQLPSNWYYFAGNPMATYQPQPGEQVAWFVTSGVQRRNDIHKIAERTNVVVVPFSPGTYTF